MKEKSKEELLIKTLLNFKKMYDRQNLMMKIVITLSAISIGACLALIFILMMVR